MMQGIQFFKRTALSLATVGLTFGIYSSAEAVGPYILGLGLNNQNPADMSMVHQYEFSAEGVSFNLHMDQSNFTINGVPGSAPTGHTDILPYFHAAYRTGPKWVFGFDYNHPFWVNIGYGMNSFVNGLAVNTVSRSDNFNPRVSYQINSNLAIGFGLDALHTSSGELSAQIPTGGPLFTAIQDANSWAWGWDGGIFLTVRKGTYASLAVFSQIAKTDHGQSNYSVLNSNDSPVTIKVPTTFVLRLTQFFSPTWLVQFMGAYDEQSAQQQLYFRSPALGQPLIVPQNEHNSFQLSLLTRYQYNAHWAFLAGGSYEDGSQPLATNLVSLPIGNQWAAFAGPCLNLSKILSLQLVYAHVWSNSNFNFVSQTANPPAPTRVLGFNHTNANLFDLKLSFKA
jgi:long-subunit fatty acid transport protein